MLPDIEIVYLSSLSYFVTVGAPTKLNIIKSII